MTRTLAIDFGTSNTAAAVMRDGAPWVLPIDDGRDTLPTAVFLDFTRRDTLFGQAAIDALIDGREGRFMRALKSVLGTSLMHEKRQFLQERLTLTEIVARFLSALKAGAEAETGDRFDRVLSGRPVRFHSADAARNARAEDDLRACYHAAGFAEVTFLPEPEAAARAALPDGGDRAGLGLVVDIGGGTSDFTVFEGSGADIRVLASHGVRIGGTDFDKAISLAHAMPLLGRGSLIRAELGAARNPAPAALFNDLASWEKIPFVYDPATLRDVARMQRLADEPEKLARLHDVLELHLGHDVAFAVEAAKIAGQADRAQIDLGAVERGLAVDFYPLMLDAAIAPFATEITEAASETLRAAGCTPDDIAEVILVGGSSLLSTVSNSMAALLPAARLRRGKAFTAIVEGLAIAAGQADAAGR